MTPTRAQGAAGLTFDLDADAGAQGFLDWLCWWLCANHPAVATLAGWSNEILVHVELHPERGSVIDVSTPSLSVSVDGERVDVLDLWVQQDMAAGASCVVREILTGFGFTAEERRQVEARFDARIAQERQDGEPRQEMN